jgi:hypothetical protein
MVKLYRGSERLNILKKVPIWGSLSRFGPYLIERIHGRIDTTQYLCFIQKVVSRNGCNTPINFVHDRYPVHRAKVVMQWFRDNKKKIELIPWPADFGDLMPLELVWEEIAEMINNKGNGVSSEEELWQEINRCWSELFSEQFYIGGLTYRIPFLLKKIFNNHGDWGVERV